MSVTHNDIMPPINSNFDPVMHRPPKFDIYGNMVNFRAQPGEDPRNILKDKDKIGIHI